MTARRQLIELMQDYSQQPFVNTDFIGPVPLYDLSRYLGSSPQYAICQAVFHLDRGSGVTFSDIWFAVESTYPGKFSEVQLENAMTAMLNSGILMRLTPIVLNVLAPVSAVKVTFSPRLDHFPRNRPYTFFLLALVGGYSSSSFSLWFRSRVPVLFGSSLSSASSCQSPQI